MFLFHNNRFAPGKGFRLEQNLFMNIELCYLLDKLHEMHLHRPPGRALCSEKAWRRTRTVARRYYLLRVAT